MEHEADGAWYYEQVELGYNYRMTDIQAALLISQLDKLPLFKHTFSAASASKNCFLSMVSLSGTMRRI